MLGRVTEREVFRRFRSEGLRSRAGPLTLVRLPRGEGPPAVAFAVSRRVGTAVVRNRLRRQLRTAFRDCDRDRLLGSDAYLVIPDPNAAGASMNALRGWIDECLQRSGRCEGPQDRPVGPR